MNGCGIFPVEAGTNGNWNSYTTTIYFPPAPILTECALTGVVENGDSWAVECTFVEYSTRQADGSDLPVPVNETSIYDPAMSSLTYFVASARSNVYGRVVMQYW